MSAPRPPPPAPPPAPTPPPPPPPPSNVNIVGGGGNGDAVLQTQLRRKAEAKGRTGELGQWLAGVVGTREAMQLPEDRQRKIKVVCISDTHEKHWDIKSKVPDGDILIHSGDFGTRLRNDDNFEKAIADFDKFMASFPHTHKFFVGGNHEIAFNDYTAKELQRRMPSVVYLQDEAHIIKEWDLHLYGSPWTSSRKMGFSCSSVDLEKRWKKIPKHTDILITHMPPHNILDLAHASFKGGISQVCDVCGKKHPMKKHWGSTTLRTHVLERVRPLVHCYGHVHDENGFRAVDDVLFVNSSMDCAERPVVFEIVVKGTAVQKAVASELKVEGGGDGGGGDGEEGGGRKRSGSFFKSIKKERKEKKDKKKKKKKKEKEGKEKT
eukprot:TRINITY_DN633_c0_g5_i1.p1 TRINITY_DN633_c0_g5~~TRINITY_DN633_c0_g5_i1.p1  ORF type:complete len:379 (-),score=125.29 TRINITY_DN633_c0_g5_i1:92-1228(-)